MFRPSAAVAALLLIPTIAAAQRAGGSKVRGDREADWNAIDKSVQTLPQVKKGDIENFSAVLVIVDKKKDLKLSDDQLAKFKDLGKAEESYNQPLYDRVDSLKNAMRHRSGEDPDQERARTTLARQELMNVIRQIRSNYDSTFKTSCLPILDDTQKKAAEEIIQKEREDAEEDLRGKIGGSRGGGAMRTKRP